MLLKRYIMFVLILFFEQLDNYFSVELALHSENYENCFRGSKKSHKRKIHYTYFHHFTPGIFYFYNFWIFHWASFEKTFLNVNTELYVYWWWNLWFCFSFIFLAFLHFLFFSSSIFFFDFSRPLELIKKSELSPSNLSKLFFR
jgi:hypothetical protein